MLTSSRSLTAPHELERPPAARGLGLEIFSAERWVAQGIEAETQTMTIQAHAAHELVGRAQIIVLIVLDHHATVSRYVDRVAW
jgi:hypothetical protein